MRVGPLQNTWLDFIFRKGGLKSAAHAPVVSLVLEPRQLQLVQRQVERLRAVSVHDDIVVAVVLLQLVRLKLDVVVQLVSLERLPRLGEEPGARPVDAFRQHGGHQRRVRHDGHVVKLVLDLGAARHDPRLPLHVVGAARDEREERVAAVRVRVVELVQREAPILETVLAQHVLRARPNFASESITATFYGLGGHYVFQPRNGGDKLSCSIIFPAQDPTTEKVLVSGMKKPLTSRRDLHTRSGHIVKWVSRVGLRFERACCC